METPITPGESAVWYRRERGGRRGGLHSQHATVVSVSTTSITLEVRRWSGGVRRVAVQLVHRIRRAEKALIVFDDSVLDFARTPAQRKLLEQWYREHLAREP